MAVIAGIPGVRSKVLQPTAPEHDVHVNRRASRVLILVVSIAQIRQTL